jgi:hypothetical protein
VELVRRRNPWGRTEQMLRKGTEAEKCEVKHFKGEKRRK